MATYCQPLTFPYTDIGPVKTHAHVHTHTHTHTRFWVLLNALEFPISSVVFCVRGLSLGAMWVLLRPFLLLCMTLEYSLLASWEP